MQRFLGFANFYRRFIQGFSIIVAPLTALTTPKQTFTLDQATDQAFSELKRRFVEATILTYRGTNSWNGVGAILPQRSSQDQKIQPCAFYSKHFTPVENNYSDLEFLAIKLALEEWRHWLESTELPVTLWTDHKNLLYIQTVKRLNLVNTADLFTGFDLNIPHKPGPRNTKPNALSRHFSPDDLPENLSPIVPCTIESLSWDIESLIKKAQVNKPETGAGPAHCLPVPSAVCSRVIQWGHVFGFLCHPGSNPFPSQPCPGPT